nr:LicD family protein [Adlercreutzia sp. ZJ473]
MGQIQSEEIRLLNEFVSICHQYGLRYYLAYGAVLGAIRHDGPIPWDDDIDLYMPRPDFDRLIALTPASVDCKLLDVNAPDYAWYGVGKFVSTRTQFSEPDLVCPEDYGVFLDIFPLDGVRADNAKKLYGLHRVVRKLEKIGYHFDSKNTTLSGGGLLLRKVFGGFARLAPMSRYRKLLWKIEHTVDFSEAEYLVNFSSVYSLEKELKEPNCCDGDLVGYSGKAYFTVKNPEGYLCQVYGQNWRTPIKREEPSHGRAEWRA